MEDLKDNNLIEQDRIYVENRIENVNFNIPAGAIVG